MQDVQRKTKKIARHGRAWLLAAALAVLAGALVAWRALSAPGEAALPETHADTAVTLMAHEAEEVARVAVTLRAGEGWTAVQSAPGVLTMADDPDFILSEGWTAAILNAVKIIACEAVLTDDPALYREDLPAFGLDDPRLTATVRYTDGETVTLRVGDAVSEEDAAWFYLTVDGDDRLFAIDRGTVDDLTVDRGLLYPVTQPVLHAARFDRITLTGAEGVIGAWALEGEIGDADAADRWFLTAPTRYPADAQALANLRQNLASLRLGGYVGPATGENLARCGFDAPRLVISAHQAAGSFGTANAAGEYVLTDWPESELTLTVGAALSEDIDYICYEGSIYTGSHYLLSALMETDGVGTLTRYIAPVALGNLARLVIERGGEREEYVLTRTERVAENNELVTDPDGRVVVDVAVTRNGEPVDGAAFEASYGRLIVAKVSGKLPEGWEVAAEPHTVYTFHDGAGEAHVVAFADFDALHDAVIVDGVAVFYLIKGGFGME